MSTLAQNHVSFIQVGEPDGWDGLLRTCQRRRGRCETLYANGREEIGVIAVGLAGWKNVPVDARGGGDAPRGLACYWLIQRDKPLTLSNLAE